MSVNNFISPYGSLVVAVLLLWFDCSSAQSDPYHLRNKPESSFNIYYNMEKALVYPNRVRAIRLRGLKLGKIPDDIRKLANLEYLDLTDNEITLGQEDIEVIRSLKDLKCIILFKNKISEVGDEFANALSPSVEVICLGRNRIGSLPAGFAKLKNVKFLSLIGNQFKSFPESILGMDGLVALWLLGSEIQKMDCDFSGLEHLEDLHLAGNLLESVKVRLPGSIEGVSFARNKIVVLEGNFEECRNLEFVNMEDNPGFIVPENLKALVKKGILVVDGPE